MEWECEVARANAAIMRFLALFVLDRHDLRMRALRALKKAPVMVGLIGWLDKRKKHRKPAHQRMVSAYPSACADHRHKIAAWRTLHYVAQAGALILSLSHRRLTQSPCR